MYPGVSEVARKEREKDAPSPAFIILSSYSLALTMMESPFTS